MPRHGLVDWGAAMCYLSSNRFALGVPDMVVADLSALNEVVQEAIGEERLGQPQFLRCLAQVSVDCLDDAFVQCVEDGHEPDVNPRVAASMTEVILGAYASAARGEEVSLPLPR